MLIRRAYFRLLVALALASMTLFTSSAYGQSPATQRDSPSKEVAAAQGPRLSSPEKKDVEGTRPSDLENDVAAVKTENAAVREQLRKMEEQNQAMAEQQKALLELVDGLKRQLDGLAIAGGPRIAQPLGPAPATESPVSTAAAEASQPSPPAPIEKDSKDDDRYRDGLVLFETKEDDKIPFMLKTNVTLQVRYLNTLNSKDTFTDHLGNVREVNKRNDITLNRAMFTLGGYAFDKRLQYGMLVWTSAGSSLLVIAGTVGWRFNKALTITAGYAGLPGSRSLVNTFPFFTGIDRSMADNFFRPGFTQGIWASGEPVKGLNYQVFVGNGLNTLNISANKIDTNLMVSGDVWWEPLGAYSEPGRSRQMYDDFFAQKKTRIRLGTSFTNSKEDRFSNLDQSAPDNTALHNSDGVLTFSTGAFAPGVTVNKATYRMWAIDGGIKYNGLAVNGQYYMRWVDNFEADGPLPLTSMFDHGFELSASKFVIPKKLVVYGRGSYLFGNFNNSSEYGGGFKWHFLPTERLWLQGEVMRVSRVPYGGAFTPYNPGLNGWMPMMQTVLAF
ncbi:MAG TPA: hypothetical protein VGN90_10985 [Pyrinomonadaceae bacterium]|nr:hypothetical protein [Pyrinomonadaceae bacterium]